MFVILNIFEPFEPHSIAHAEEIEISILQMKQNASACCYVNLSNRIVNLIFIFKINLKNEYIISLVTLEFNMSLRAVFTIRLRKMRKVIHNWNRFLQFLWVKNQNSGS